MKDYYLAFDVGGTSIKYGLIDKDLHYSNQDKVLTNHNQDGQILKSLIEITKVMQAEFSIKAIGVSTAGIVGKEGEIKFAGPTIPGYTGTQIKKELEKSSGLSVNVINDVDAALMGERLAGAARNSDSVYCVALGTGIGGAYYDGKLEAGFNDNGNSIGYTLYDPRSKTYYEQRASTLVLDAQLKKLGISVPDAFALAKKGNEQYMAIIDDWALEVATGLSNILLLYDPEVLLIGGAVSLQGQFLIDLLKKHLEVLVPKGLLQATIKTAQLADRAQVYGAIAKFFE